MEQNAIILNTILDEIKNIKAEMNDMKTNMLTKNDTKNFATKEDLKAFATKEDLKAFVTKDDLKAFATKEDLKAFATKEDLKAFATKEDLKKCATKDDIKRVMKEIKEIKFVINGLADDIAMLDERTRSLVVYKYK